ncbi:MAG: RnfABCDGE type electron transport complex subunit B [Tepidanaerobacter acetatoxydans]|uniref:RnfABCDGE type electron transport complex subunit B n=1 Tax=Tepidanaerobacter acetatoxydans TaxID=499229 RepID=UPI0026F1847F|nr:RnfABCDGE type electron transport complex subunit B [Tepidanaerobacter acetatoxydans]NLU11060.1 RnfABCDGE type electron transport complex subunit B [Tepidanaerobacter acetatoxydans]
MADIIITSVLSMGGLGLLLGGGLALASKKLAVETDPRVDAIIEALPGANCGACGYPGCSGLAKAIVEGKAPVNTCPVGGAPVAEKIAKIMGMDEAIASTERKVARVLCQGGKTEAKLKSEYHGIKTCKAASMINNGPKACPFACIGFGDCKKVCPVGAITIGENGLPYVDEEKCIGCGLCAQECPKDVLALIPEKNEVRVSCRATMKAKDTRAVCSSGCIACKQCEKVCPFDAIHVNNNVAAIDYEKCRNCMLCVEKCPTGAITSAFAERKKAVIIEEKCIGCTLCAKNCPVNAISGEVKKVHKVDQDICIGCGICQEKCRKDAIKMVRNGQKDISNCDTCTAVK